MEEFFEYALRHTFGEEGGYANVKGDPGGPTNIGVTLETMQKALGTGADLNHDGKVDAEDVKLLTREQAAAIYRAWYWREPGFDLIGDIRVAAKVFDIGVNAGPRVATILLQRAIAHSAPPGVAHPRDDGVLAACDPEIVVAALCSEQKLFYLSCIEHDPVKVKFKDGWLKRAGWVPGERNLA